jgi:hypothetical protein
MKGKSSIFRKACGIGAAFVAAAFLAFIEWAFAKSWLTEKWMYIPPYVSGVGAACLLMGALAFRTRPSISSRIQAASSVLVTLMAFLFLVEITPIAQGNNDSGEVFWFVMLPAIFLTAYAYSAHRIVLPRE